MFCISGFMLSVAGCQFPVTEFPRSPFLRHTVSPNHPILPILNYSNTPTFQHSTVPSISSIQPPPVQQRLYLRFSCCCTASGIPIGFSLLPFEYETNDNPAMSNNKFMVFIIILIIFLIDVSLTYLTSRVTFKRNIISVPIKYPFFFSKKRLPERGRLKTCQVSIEFRSSIQSSPIQ